MTLALSAFAIVIAVLAVGVSVINSTERLVQRLDSQNYLLDKIARKLDRAGEGGLDKS